ncbi:Opr family porin [Sulfurimonas sp.]|uniref:Opr family porin n=1 Tax=Sulfurimonas sp. TaxID=2022749 RepID=UPI0025EF9D81|nr:Opr family porin [Sulfurimonas sp.]
MKSTKLSLVATIAIMGMFSGVNANEFDEAFTKGTLTGDATVTYETRDQKDDDKGAYYTDEAYSVASAELIYKTAKFYDFSLTYGMRGYKVLWEDDANSAPANGTGDASSRFYNIDGGDTAQISNAYLAYNTKIIDAKFGRQKISGDWINKTHDAVNITVNPMEKLAVGLIWTNTKDMRVLARDLRALNNDINGNDGIYKLDVTYKIMDSLKATAYALHAPTSHSVYGGKVMLDSKANDVSFGGFAHYMQTDEIAKNTDGSAKDDGSMYYAKAYVGYSGVTAALGYIKTGKDAGWASANAAGETIDPFEEGDALFYVDAATTYATLSTTLAGVSLSGIYGMSEYSASKGSDTLKENEFCLWAGYDLTKQLNLSAIVTLLSVDDDAPNSDMTQLSSTLTYKF